MIKRRGILYCMTTILLIVIVFLCKIQDRQPILSFRIFSGDCDQTVTLWKNDAGGYYAFLPGYAQMEDVRIKLHTDTPVYINGLNLVDGMTCVSFEEGTSYPFSYTVWGKQEKDEIVFLRSANIAAMHIETQSGNMRNIHRSKGNKEEGKLTLYLPDGTVNYSGTLISIQGRGNSTWGVSEKKPYSIKLTKEADLLGLGKAQKWVLLANARDSSHMRNKLVYDFANRVGMAFTPGSDWIDLYLNGEYAGLYLLSERNEVHQERVNIAENGSFLVSMELATRLGEQNYTYVSTQKNQNLRVHYPSAPSDMQLQDLERTWQSVENAILAEDKLDPVTGKSWLELIDLDSWVKKYLIEEIFGNIDGCYISQYFYYDESNVEGKIYAGPVWDYDLAIGPEIYEQRIAPNTLYANRYDVVSDYCAPWFHALYNNDLFYSKIVEKYQCEFLPLLDEFLCNSLLAYSRQIDKSFGMNKIRWSLEDVDIDGEVNFLRNYMQERIAFLSSLWIENQKYYTVKVENTTSENYCYYAVLSGENLDELPDFENVKNAEFLGWYIADTDEPFSVADPIYEDMEIYAKWEEQNRFPIGRIVKIVPLSVLLMFLLIVMLADWKKVSLKR